MDSKQNTHRAQPSWLIVALSTAMAIAVGACGGGIEEADPDAPIFEGFDPAVVAEAIAMPPEAKEDPPRSSYASQDEYEQHLAQAAYVIEVCRDMDVAYRQWISTGTPPQLSPEPIVNQSATTRLHQIAEDAINAGDVDLLFEWLAGVEGCGGWVPSAPGSSETIQDTYERT